MTQSIAGSRPFAAWPWTESDTSSGPPPPLHNAAAPSTRDLPAPHDPPQPARPAIEVAILERTEMPRIEARDAAVQRGLDAFRGAMTATYHWSNQVAPVPVPFYMSNPAAKELTPQALRDLQSASRRAHVESDLPLIRAGRGTPEQISALTQALIDEGRLPTDTRAPPMVAVRQMMSSYRIGIDCAGYVQQAYLRAIGVDRGRAHFRAIESEDLSNLGARGYRRIDDLSDASPGDLVVLAAPPAVDGDLRPVGHRAIVYDQHQATPAEMRTLLQFSDSAQSFAVGGPIRVFFVDSSWGCGGNPRVGGTRREEWWYNRSTHQWGWHEQGDGLSARRFWITPTPYGHPFAPPASGIFRAAEARP